jgi:hypothetical protein
MDNEPQQEYPPDTAEKLAGGTTLEACRTRRPEDTHVCLSGANGMV